MELKIDTTKQNKNVQLSASLLLNTYFFINLIG